MLVRYETIVDFWTVIYLKFVKDLFPPIADFLFIPSSHIFFLLVFAFNSRFVADAATGMYAELMQRYFCSDKCPFQSI